MTIESINIGQFIRTLGEKSPTPGGGAVASVVAALGAALGQMVINYSIGKKKLAPHDDLHQQALSSLDSLAQRMLNLAAADAKAYGALNDLMKLEKDDPKRVAEWAEAVEAAINAPQGVIAGGCEMMDLLEKMIGTTNKMLASDLAIAAILAEAGAKAGAWNVRINLPLLGDESKVQTHEAGIEQSLRKLREARERIEQACATQA